MESCHAAQRRGESYVRLRCDTLTALIAAPNWRTRNRRTKNSLQWTSGNGRQTRENREMAMLSLILLAFCALVVLAAISVGTFFVLLKLGVIVREASRPTIQDYGNY